MSFVRLPPRPRHIARPGSKLSDRPEYKRKRPKRKPGWDDTQSDLSVYRASPDEIERRKAAHQSKNLDLVREEKVNKKIAKARVKDRTPGSSKKLRQNALIREILFNQSQLSDALSKSDQVMAVVKDLFGDDPKRYRGLPNVTVAPDGTGLDSSLPDGTTIEGPTKLDLLSESVMNKSALNELEDQEYESEGSEAEQEEPIQYRPAIDLQRFQKFLQSEKERSIREEGKAKLTQSMADRALYEMAQLRLKQPTQPGVNKQAQPVTHDGSYLAEDTPPTTPKVAAMNDTEKVERTRARTDQGQNPKADERVEDPGGAMHLDDLRKVLDGLESNIADYESQTGRQPAPQRLVPGNFSGYTVALVDAVSRLTSYVKESDVRLRAEATLRDQLAQDVGQMHALVDALTSDIIATQEEYAKLQIEFLRYKQSTSLEIQALKESLHKHGIQIIPIQQPPPVETIPARLGVHTLNAQKPLTASQDVRIPGLAQQLNDVTPSLPQNYMTSLVKQQQLLTSQQQQLLKSTQQQNMMTSSVQQQDLMAPAAEQHKSMTSTSLQESNFRPVQQQSNVPELPMQNHLPPAIQQHYEAGPASMHQDRGFQPVPQQQGGGFQPVPRQQGSIFQPVPQQQDNKRPTMPQQHFDRTSEAPMTEHSIAGSQSTQSEEPITVDELAAQMSQRLKTANRNLGAMQAAMLLTPPRQTNSPRVQGGKFMASRQQIHSAIQSLKAETAGMAKDGAHPQQRVPSQLVPPSGQASEQKVVPPGGSKPSIPVPNLPARPNLPRPTLAQGHVVEDLEDGLISSPQSLASGEVPSHGPQRAVLQQQIAELNRQHAEAQNKLQLLLQQQQDMQVDVRDAAREMVSPPISPITLASESEATEKAPSVVIKGGKQTEKSGPPGPVPISGGGNKATHRGITISIPRVETVEWSDTNSPSPAQPERAHRHTSQSPVTTAVASTGEPRGQGYAMQQGQAAGGWLALSSHVAAS